MNNEVFEEMQGAAGGAKAKLEKQARQLAYDTKYKVKQALAAKSGGKADPATVSKMYMAQLSKSPAPPAVKALAKKKLLGEEYIDTREFAVESVTQALLKVFAEKKEEVVEEVIEEEKKTRSGETKFHVRVRDKKTGNTYHRYATRAKIAELRANPNIESVEMTHQGEGETKKAQKDYDGDGKVESSSKEHAGAVHNAIQRRTGGTPDGQDTRKEEVEFIDEGLRSAVKRLLGKKDAPAEKKPESRGEQLRKKYNIGPEKSDTSAKRQILDRTRAKAERDQKQYGGSVYTKSVADKSKAAHDRYLKAGYSKYGAGDARGRGNKAHRRAEALKKEDFNWLVDSLISEGYDLSSYTVEQFYDFCGELLDEIHTQAHTPHEVPSKNLKGLVKKAVKRIDADVDGDVDTDDPKSTEMGEFIPSPDGKKKIKTKVQREDFLSDWRDELFEGKKKNEDGEEVIDVMKGKNKITVSPTIGEKMNLAKADMGDVVKDFYKSDAPQFKGKSKEERRQMAIAAKLTAERGGKKLGEALDTPPEKEKEEKSKVTPDDQKQLQAKKQMLNKKRMLQMQTMQLQKQGKLPLNYSEECGCEEKCPKCGKSPCECETDSREMRTKTNLVRNKLRAMGLKMSYELEGGIVEGRALGTANKKSSDTNPKGSNLRASSGRGGTFTKAGGLGKKKTFKNNPDGDDMVKSMYDKQAKDDRREAARQRAAEKKVVRIVKNSYEVEGETVSEEGADRLRDRRMERGGVGGNLRYDRPPARKKTNAELGIDPKAKTAAQKAAEAKYGKGASAMDIVKAQIRAKHGKGAIMDTKKKDK